MLARLLIAQGRTAPWSCAEVIITEDIPRARNMATPLGTYTAVPPQPTEWLMELTTRIVTDCGFHRRRCGTISTNGQSVIVLLQS